jgi:ketosteroid isomerase-like protein
MAINEMTELDDTVQRYRQTLAHEFVNGNPQPFKALWSQREDVVLANPFGPAVRGWREASAAMDYASSRFSDGEFSRFERIGTYVTAELATIFEVEHGRLRVGGGPVGEFDLRVTTTFRREDGAWKVVHRHADPINTPSSDGPLRTT